MTMGFWLSQLVRRTQQRPRGGHRHRRTRRIRSVELLEPRLTLDAFGVVADEVALAAGEIAPAAPLEFTWQEYPIPADALAAALPTDVAIGDFDGDDLPDVAFTVSNRDIVSLRINDAAGGFSKTPRDVELGPDGAGPIALVPGQFDGHGSLDLAVANSLTGNVSVLLNFHGTTFESIRHVRIGLSPRALDAGDLDHDGDLDLVVADEWAGQVSILFNDGQGTFSRAATAPPVLVGEAPFAVVLAQLNDDNRDGQTDAADDLDAAVACFGSQPDPSDPGGLWILRNNGSGTLRVAEHHLAGLAPSSLAAADLDADRNIDLAVANYLSNDVSIFTNKGGTLTLTHTDRGIFEPMDLAALDLNADGHVDLAVTSRGTTRVGILRNCGDGTLACAEFHYPVPFMADFPTCGQISVAGGSFQGDGLLDLVISDGKRSVFWVLENVSTGASAGADAVGDRNAPPSDSGSGDSGESLTGVAESVWEAPASQPTTRDRLDVNHDGVVSAADVLRAVNFLNQHGPVSLLATPALDPRMLSLDVDGDDWVTPADVLILINCVNVQPVGEGESSGVARSSQTGQAEGERATGRPDCLDGDAVSEGLLTILANDLLPIAIQKHDLVIGQPRAERGERRVGRLRRAGSDIDAATLRRLQNSADQRRRTSPIVVSRHLLQPVTSIGSGCSWFNSTA